MLHVLNLHVIDSFALCQVHYFSHRMMLLSTAWHCFYLHCS